MAYNYNEVNNPKEFIENVYKSLKGLKKLSIKDIVDEDDRKEIIDILTNIVVEFESDYEEDDLRDSEKNKRK